MGDEREQWKALIRHLFAQSERNREAADGQQGNLAEKYADMGISALKNEKPTPSPETLENSLRQILRQIGEREGLDRSWPSILSSLAPNTQLHNLIEYYLQEHPMEDLISQAQKELMSVRRRQEWDVSKSHFFGPNGPMRTLMKGLQQMAPDQRPALGQRINTIKSTIEALFADKLREIEGDVLRQQLPEPIDITLKPRRSAHGSLHPITQLRDRIDAIFHRIGYSIAEGTEIETEWFCFDALNTPPHHPARNEQDTFYLPRDLVVGNVSRRDQERHILRSQTSTVQIRTMLSEHPPFSIVSPGRVFRRDTPDATHSANFHQYEGLHVDHNVSVADLKNTLFFFLQELFGDSVQMRLRPSFFPFTEPSFEVDIRSPAMGKLSDQWVEILGCGLVDPEVFHAVHYDPEEWSGFAFALGLERIAMFLYGIDDIRHFYRNDQRFLKQFA
jgi:phenylalanyl-tRNA synthetase alpha chain